MSSISVKMLGTPVIMNEKKEAISLPFRKAEALFYYLIIKKQATRDELVDLLWGEIDEQTAKKNLRNAMYKIRKALGLDIIISPQKTHVMINPSIDIKTDLSLLYEETIESLRELDGEFLQGFLVKDAEKYEEWVYNQRENYRRLYIALLEKKINEEMNKNKYKDAEMALNKWIALEPYDERVYRLLMNIYLKLGDLNKAIDLYHRLSKTLTKELGITPDALTKSIYEEALDLKMRIETNKNERKDFFFGRKKEINILNKQFLSFQKEEDFQSILLLGEAGIGKSRLKNKFIESIPHHFYTLEAVCYQAEETYFLKPWNVILSKLTDIIKNMSYTIPSPWRDIIFRLFPSFAVQMGELHIEKVSSINPFQYQLLEEAILGVMKDLAYKRKLVLIIEDIQWIDTTSLSLLRSLLIHNKNIFFIGTSRLGYDDKLESFLPILTKYNKIEKIELPRFTKAEVEDFISTMELPSIVMDENLLNKIYDQTEGNPFFLVELINILKENGTIDLMTDKIQDILKSRFIGISEEGKKLLNIASIFFDEVTLEILVKLIGKGELEILDLLEELQHKFILIERVDGDTISFQFTHQKLREFIYNQLSNARRKVLHLKIGNLLEQYIRNDKIDTLLYSKLIYHFTKGGDKLRALRYGILNAKMYFDFNHELFPVLDMEDRQESSLVLTREQARSYLNEVEQLLLQVKIDRYRNEEIKKLEFEYLHMSGRYFIREGEYSSGIQAIDQLIDLSKGIESEFTLKGYKQMIFYAIQTHKLDIMKKYLHLAMQLVKEEGNQKEKGILLRLKGLYQILMGKYDEAEKYLLQSIRLLERLDKERYALNIAAAYHYLGEIRRNNNQLAGALQFYEKAKSLAETKEVLKGVTLFNTKAGQAAYHMRNYPLAKEYLYKAFEAYDKIGHYWGRSTAEGIMALIYIKEKDYQQGLNSIKNAEMFANKYKSPFELGLFYKTSLEIKLQLKDNDALKQMFEDYLNESSDYYYKTAIKFFKQANAKHEIEQLNVIVHST